MVFAIERGHWRVVQWHASVASGNEDTVGQALTTALERVEQSVRDDRPDLRPATAPDGTVTIVFSDIESSTVLMERLGDIEWLRMLAWHDGIVKDTTGEHRGFVVKSQGDGFMLAFPSSAYALRACLTMRDRIAAGYNGLPIRIRMGLHAGETIRRDDDFYGRTVVIAARISALALGGEILASDLVYALARGLGTFRFGERRTATLKGLDGSFDVYPVRWGVIPPKRASALHGRSARREHGPVRCAMRPPANRKRSTRSSPAQGGRRPVARRLDAARQRRSRAARTRPASPRRRRRSASPSARRATCAHGRRRATGDSRSRASSGA